MYVEVKSHANTCVDAALMQVYCCTAFADQHMKLCLPVARQLQLLASVLELLDQEALPHLSNAKDLARSAHMLCRARGKDDVFNNKQLADFVRLSPQSQQVPPESKY